MQGCTFWKWAHEPLSGAGMGEQCGVRPVIIVGQTLTFCENHARDILRLDQITQHTVGLTHVA